MATTASESTKSAALFGLAAFALFSGHDVLVKQLGVTYSPFQIVFFTALLSFPLVTLALMNDKKEGTLRPVHPWWLALRSISGSASAVFAYYAFSQLPLSQAYAILFCAPLIITLLSVPMLGETIRIRRGLAILVGLGGVMIVLRPGSAELGLGHLAAFFSATTGALNSIIVRKIGHDERAAVMVLYPMMTNFLLTAAVLPLVYVPVAVGDLGLFAVVALLVLLAMSSLVLAYDRGTAMVVAPMQYSQIIWAAVFGALLFGDFPDWQTYLGTGIIAASSLYIMRRENTASVSKNSPVSRTRTRIGLALGMRVGLFIKR